MKEDKKINWWAWSSGIILLLWLLTLISCAVFKVEKGLLFNMSVGFAVFFLPWILLLWLASVRNKGDDIEQAD